MKQTKLILGVLLVIFVGFISFGLFTYPKVKDVNSDSFSAVRVAKDLKIISKEHHSIEHPIERAVVRQYLYDRLDQMGGAPQFLPFDSIQSRIEGFIDIADVYCQFDPKDSLSASSYVMMVAHFDSRFRQQVLNDTVYSYGAADDGYGVGVILECLNMALKYRNEWHQGVKMLFTDSEENELDGMRCAYEKHKELFDKVGLILNVEARGVKGPALLFETSSPNSELLELYEEAKYQSTYSLTSVVYNFLPNFTDFTVVKNDLPGMNFSVLDNLNYYHTDKDNYSNINLKSIQHYGAQIEPMLHKYLTDDDYSDPLALTKGEDDISFYAPGLKNFHFPKDRNILYNSIVFALLCIAFAFHLLSGSITVKGVLRNALFIFLSSIGILAVGEGIAYVASLIVGTPFNLVGTKYIRYDWLINIVAMVLMVALYLVFYLRRRNKSIFFVKEHIFGALLCMMVFTIVLLFTIGENFFFMIPLALTAVALIFYMFVFFNILSLPALLCIELLMFSFLYNLITALTIGSLGVVMFIGFYSLILMSGLFECYMIQKR